MDQRRLEREPTKLITTRELAERLGFRPDTIRRWAREDRIPSLRVGEKTLRFDFADVLSALRGSDASGEVSDA